MRRITLDEFGGPEVMRVEEVAEPEPPRDGYVVQVVAAGVNFADVVERRGRYRRNPELPFHPGIEAAGTVVARGPEASEHQVGDTVIAIRLDGGCYAERVAVGPRQVLRTQAALSDHELAGYAVAFATAWHALCESARVRADESVLIQAGAGGVGSAAVQLARALGCRPVLATASAPEKCSWVEALGADRCIDYTREDLARAIERETGGRGVDVVLESVAGAAMDAALSGLAPLGRMVLLGFSSVERGHREALGALKPLSLFHRSVGVLGLNVAHLDFPARRAAWQCLDRFVAEHGLRPQIGGTYALADAARAHADLEQRRSRGKLLLVP